MSWIICIICFFIIRDMKLIAVRICLCQSNTLKWETHFVFWTTCINGQWKDLAWYLSFATLQCYMTAQTMRGENECAWVISFKKNKNRCIRMFLQENTIATIICNNAYYVIQCHDHFLATILFWDITDF